MKIEELVEICSKLKLTPNQYIIYEIIEDQNIALAIKYVNEVGYFDKEDIEKLLERDFILPKNRERIEKTATGEWIIKDYELDGFIATSKAEDILGHSTIVDKDKMFQELWDLYPNQILIDSNRKGISKAVDPEIISKIYVRNIQGRRNLHDEVINYVKRLIELNNGYAKVKIENFIRAKLWSVPLEDNKTEDFTHNA